MQPGSVNLISSFLHTFNQYNTKFLQKAFLCGRALIRPKDKGKSVLLGQVGIW